MRWEGASKETKKEDPPAQVAPEPGSSAAHGDGKNGKSLMELLELEMRARAIKALLNKAGTSKEPDTKESGSDHKEATDKDRPEGEGAEDATKDAEEEDTETMAKLAEEEKKLQKARDALLLSTAKKQEEEEAILRKQEAMRKRIEEQRKKMEAKELAEKKKKEEEEARLAKKKKKEEDHKKFLEWKGN